MSSFHAVIRFVRKGSFSIALRRTARGVIPFKGWDYIDTRHAVKKLLFVDWEKRQSMHQRRKGSGILVRFMNKSSKRLE